MTVSVAEMTDIWALALPPVSGGKSPLDEAQIQFQQPPSEEYAWEDYGPLGQEDW